MDFDSTTANCSAESTPPCEFDDTSFAMYFHDNNDRCISVIFVQVNHVDEDEKNKNGSLFCVIGGIGSNLCVLMFLMGKKRDRVTITIYGINAPCTFKSRYVGSNPSSMDPYGLPYYSEPGQVRTSFNVSNVILQDESNDIYHYKDGLMNTVMPQFNGNFNFHTDIEYLNTEHMKSFTIDFKNYLEILPNIYLDIYWYQESEDSTPELPLIYWKDDCKRFPAKCSLVFDSKETITYVLIKVFIGPHMDPNKSSQKLSLEKRHAPSKRKKNPVRKLSSITPMQ
ncbi:hypothetical protein DMENIID0001_058700 [Sergentomyia squamirostris]